MEEATGRVERFVEKPETFVGDKINAGIYLLEPCVLDRIQLKPTSLEKEVFPQIVADEKLYAMVLPGFWMDIGQPRDYINGLQLYLDSVSKNSAAWLATGEHIVGNVLVHKTAKIGEGCLIGPHVAIGPGCVVEDGVRLSRCTLLRGSRVKKHACIPNSIVGWHSTVGQWARIENVTVLGENVHVCDEVYSNGGLFAWLISHQPAVLQSHNKSAPATSQPAVFQSHNKSAPATGHQPTEQAVVVPHREIRSNILNPEVVS